MKINILVTLDRNYIPQLRVLLTSLYINHPGQQFDIYLLHSNIPDADISKLSDELKRLQFELIPVRASDDVFDGAQISDRYPKEMYYRLLAAVYLPKSLDKILYLDPDILIINPLYELWSADISQHLFAAASHTGKTNIANDVNHIRLNIDNDYYNSGVLLMNLEACRREIDPKDVFDYVGEHSGELFLPDQDVLNALYGDRILPIDDIIWNYDARKYSNYMMRSGGTADTEWVMAHTAVMHYCGREKPWKRNYLRRFGTIYRHYMSLTERYLGTK